MLCPALCSLFLFLSHSKIIMRLKDKGFKFKSKTCSRLAGSICSSLGLLLSCSMCPRAEDKKEERDSRGLIHCTVISAPEPQSGLFIAAHIAALFRASSCSGRPQPPSFAMQKQPYLHLHVEQNPLVPLFGLPLCVDEISQVHTPTFLCSQRNSRRYGYPASYSDCAKGRQ